MLTIVTPPAEQIISLRDAKDHVRATSPDEEYLISTLVKAATQYFDGPNGVLGRCLVTQTWDLSLPAFADKIMIPLSPAQSLVSVSYFDAQNAPATLTGGEFALFKDDQSPYLVRESSATLPSTYARDDAVTFRLTLGYGAADAVPEMIKMAAKVMIESMYAERGASSQTPAKFHDLSIEAMTATYRRVW